MSANIIDGKQVAEKLRERISNAVKKIEQEHKKIPGLAVVLVGNDPASEVYVRNKGIQTKEVGMTSYEYKLPEDTPENELLKKVDEIKNYKLNSVVKGDKKIPSISAASIIAKVTRDKMIANLGKKFKGYYLEKNCGYGTKQHLKAIKNLGITSQHRKTFSPINKLK